MEKRNKHKAWIRKACLLCLFSFLFPLSSFLLSTACYPIFYEEDPLPTTQPTRRPRPTATPVPPSETDETFWALDREFGVYLLEEDPAAIAQLLVHPEEYGIDVSGIDMHLGNFTEEANARWYAALAGFEARLAEIDTDALNAQNQIGYATLAQYLAGENRAAAADYDLCYEPLVPYVGLHTDIPLFFALYDLRDTDAIESYLTLLADLPRYFGEVLVLEQRRAEAGIFMTEDALDKILADLDLSIAAKDENAPLSHFAAGVNALPGLTNAQREDYLARNEELMLSAYHTAFVSLRNGIEALRKSCREPVGALGTGDAKYIAYFADQTTVLSGANLSVDGAYALLISAMDSISARYIAATDKNADRSSFRMDSAEAAVHNLRRMTYNILPALPEHSVNYAFVPKELEAQLPPAAYLIPPLDDWSQNTVLVNRPDQDATLFFTMAHETYPGHLYQFNYQRALDLSMAQDLLPLTTYYEAWSQFSELLAATHTGSFPQKPAIRYHLNDAYEPVLMSAVSILVNAKGYSPADLAATFQSLGWSASYWERLYQISVDMPFYYMPYGFGYANMLLLQDAYMEATGDEYNEYTFLTSFLDLGPTYFNIIGPILLNGLP
ncbi:MAG: DUF885 domain-containing protein [Clostridiales bacterium]|nr:DUF885 domain-containing protein [Clostridiales bacterium]